MSQNNFNRGFTLIEVLFTISILVIVTTIVVPSLKRSYETARMNRQLDETHSFLDLASQYAISLSRQVVVSMNIDESKIIGMEIVDINTKAILDEISIHSALKLSVSPSIDKLFFSPTSSIQASLLATPITGSSNIFFQHEGSSNGKKNITVFYHSGSVQQF
jgi:prepilin-type N-terminal cleavage/methylation domain-containing protein